MALALDSSSPVMASAASGATVTTASFTAPAGALLVAFTSWDASNSAGNTDTIADSGGLIWTQQVKSSWDEFPACGQGSAVTIHTAVTSSAVARTVTATATGNPGVGAINCKVFVITGQHATTPIGAIGSNFISSSPATVSIFTSTADNSFAMVGASDWNGAFTITSSDLTNISSGSFGGAYDALEGLKSLGAAGAQTAQLTVSGNSYWAAIEVKAVAGGVVNLMPQIWM